MAHRFSCNDEHPYRTTDKYYRCFIYGGALTLELEVYLTDRVALLLNVRERALFGSDIGKFHTQVSLGLKFIIN